MLFKQFERTHLLHNMTLLYDGATARACRERDVYTGTMWRASLLALCYLKLQQGHAVMETCALEDCEEPVCPGGAGVRMQGAKVRPACLVTVTHC